MVHLKHGRLHHAGSIDDQRRNGVLDLILYNLNCAYGNHVTDRTEHETGNEAADDEVEGSSPTPSEVVARQQPARAFVTEEEREQGSINGAHTRHIFSVCWRFPSFTFLLLVYVAYGIFNLARVNFCFL